MEPPAVESDQAKPGVLDFQPLPPGTDLIRFFPATGDELNNPLFQEFTRPLIDPKKPLILALSRPDKLKNITMLIEAYGQSIQLQNKANLMIVAGNRDDI